MYAIEIEPSWVAKCGHALNVKVEAANRVPVFHRVDADGVEQIERYVFIAHVDTVPAHSHPGIVVTRTHG